MPLTSHILHIQKKRETSFFLKKAKYIIKGSIPPNSKTTKKLVTERLSLGNSAESSVINFLSVELHAVLRELESLLYQRGQLSDPPPLLTYKNEKVLKNSIIAQNKAKRKYRRNQVSRPRTFWVRVARMMISVRIGVTLTSTPE